MMNIGKEIFEKMYLDWAIKIQMLEVESSFDPVLAGDIRRALIHSEDIRGGFNRVPGEMVLPIIRGIDSGSGSVEALGVNSTQGMITMDITLPFGPGPHRCENCYYVSLIVHVNTLYRAAVIDLICRIPFNIQNEDCSQKNPHYRCSDFVTRNIF